MRRKIYNMMDCVAFGKIGEESILRFLLAQENLLGVVDARNVENTRNTDIDFMFLCEDKNWYSVEVKTDSYKSGNIFVEEKSDIALDTDGCLFSTGADFIFYYFINCAVLYIIRTRPFVAWYKKNSERFRFIGNVKNETEGWTSYNSCGRLVPGRVIETECRDYVFKVRNVNV